MPRCEFEKSWVGRCKNEAPEGLTMCKEHIALLCAGCGRPATRDCSHTGIQFVCGAPLCGDCGHGLQWPWFVEATNA